MCFLFGRENIGSRFKTVHFFDRNVSADSQRFIVGILRLIIIEIAIIGGRHNNIVPHLRRFDAAARATPRHYGGIRRQFTFQNLVPADNAASVIVQELFDSGGNVALQIMLGLMPIFVAQTQFFDARLAFRAFFPAHFRAFIAADVYVFRGEQFHNFREHAFQKSKYGVISGAKYIVENAPG